MDLKEIYLTSLARCAPDALVRTHVTADMPRNVVAIGKCAGALLDGVAAVHDIDSAFVALPEGYPPPAAVNPAIEVHVGGHPQYTRGSFAAGRALQDYVDRHADILFLVSGGGSACVEVPIGDEAHAMRANAQLIASGKPIGEINAARRAMSAIKGGRLAARVRGRAVTLVYSDVSTGALADVASGPSLPGSEAILVADNTTLVRAAAQMIGDKADLLEEQVEGDISSAAAMLAARARSLRPGQVVVAGGEPTVVVRGDGRGGRCTELAVRFAAQAGRDPDRRYHALFASSDGVDGNSGAAGVHLDRGLTPPPGWERALARSDSFPIAAQIGEPIMIAPTGNNLRDLFLVACV